MASYKGNIGIMELIKFNREADEKTKKKVDKLIDQGKDKEAWRIIQDTLGIQLVGKQFRK